MGLNHKFFYLNGIKLIPSDIDILIKAIEKIKNNIEQLEKPKFFEKYLKTMFFLKNKYDELYHELYNFDTKKIGSNRIFNVRQKYTKMFLERLIECYLDYASYIKENNKDFLVQYMLLYIYNMYSFNIVKDQKKFGISMTYIPESYEYLVNK